MFGQCVISEFGKSPTNQDASVVDNSETSDWREGCFLVDNFDISQLIGLDIEPKR